MWTRERGKETLWGPVPGWMLFYDKANAPAELKVKEDLFPSRQLEAFRIGLEDRWIPEEGKRLALQRLKGCIGQGAKEIEEVCEWWHRFLHGYNGWKLKFALLHKRKVVVSNVRYYLD